MLNRKLAIVLFIFLLIGVGGVITYSYYERQNSISDQNILTGNVVSDNIMLSPSKSPIGSKCSLSSTCQSGICENKVCIPRVSCRCSGSASCSTCLNSQYGFSCNYNRFWNPNGRCVAEFTSSGSHNQDILDDKCYNRYKNDPNPDNKVKTVFNLTLGRCVAPNTNNPTQVCGNGIKEGDEECDLGNNQNGFPNSGCSKDCKKVVKLSGRCDEKWSLTNMEGCAEGQVCIDNLCKINDNINWPPPDIPDRDGTVQVSTTSTDNNNHVCEVTPQLCDAAGGNCGEGVGGISGQDCSSIEVKKKLSIYAKNSCISIEKIKDVLKNSPALNCADDFYNYGEQYGIDPAISLAFFRQESSFGTAGVAVRTKSIGNIKYSNSCKDFGGKNVEGYCGFDDWCESVEYWYSFISGSGYAGGGLVSVDDIIRKYAPEDDGNDVKAYTCNIKTWVKGWRDK